MTMTMTMTMTMGRGRGRGRSRSRSRSRSLNLSGAGAGAVAGNLKNGRLRQPWFNISFSFCEKNLHIWCFFSQNFAAITAQTLVFVYFSAGIDSLKIWKTGHMISISLFVVCRWHEAARQLPQPALGRPLGPQQPGGQRQHRIPTENKVLNSVTEISLLFGDF